MPNWCENDLTLTGPEKDAVAFFKYAKGKVPKTDEHDEVELLIDFNKFVPQFEKITREMIDWSQWPTHEVGDDELWWYWRAENWGTKWQPAGCQMLDDDYEYDGNLESGITFDTAWAPPKPVIMAASKKFPSLEFDLRYCEPNVGYNGMYVCKGGEVKADHSAPHYMGGQ